MLDRYPITPPSPWNPLPLVAFGDSIVVGSGASTQANAFAYIYAAAHGSTFTNSAVNGTQVADNADTIYATAIASGSQYLWLPAFNDMRFYGASTNIVFNRDSILALCAWMAIPDADKYRAQNLTKWGYTGTWANDATYGGAMGRAATVGGSTATITLHGSIIYIASRYINGGTGQFTVTVDGVSQGTFNCSGNSTANSGRTYQPFIARVTGLTNTVHTVVVTSVGGGNCYLDWAASIADKKADNAPIVLLGTTPRMNAAGYALAAPFNLGSDTAVTNYGNQILVAFSRLSADGLKVFVADAAVMYYPDDGQANADNIHPGDTGHAAIAKAFSQSFIREVANMAYQDNRAVTIVGGTVDNTTIGGTTPAGALFTTVNTTGTLQAAGATTLAPTAVTSGTLTALTLTDAASTGMTAATEVPSVNLNLSSTKQWATGALATQRFVRMQAPTIGFVGASVVTKAVTLSIGGAPIQGTNATLTAKYAIEVESGVSKFSDTTAASSETVGSLVVGNGTAATSVAIGSGTVFAGASVTVRAASGIGNFTADSVTSGGQCGFNFKDAGSSKWNVYKETNNHLSFYDPSNGVVILDLTPGNAASCVVTFGGSLDASAIGTASIVVPGGLSVAKQLRVGSTLTLPGGTLLATSAALTNGAASTSPTLGSTGPAGATTPTKWIPINDNGTTRYVPSW